MTDITGAWTAACIGNQIVPFLWSGCGFVKVEALERKMLNLFCYHFSFFLFFLVGQLIFLAICPHNVGEVDRFFLPQVPPVLLLCCAGFRRDACSLPLVPSPPSLSWHPLVHSFIHLPIHPSIFAPNGSSLWLGLMSPEFLYKHNAAGISCIAWFYFVSGETFCQGRSVVCLRTVFILRAVSLVLFPIVKAF